MMALSCGKLVLLHKYLLMKLVFFRIPKPRRFNYPPRYYDEEKERLERRKKELGIGGSNGKAGDHRANLSGEWQRLRYRDRTRRKSRQISLLVYILLAAILMYFIFLM